MLWFLLGVVLVPAFAWWAFKFFKGLLGALAFAALIPVVLFPHALRGWRRAWKVTLWPALFCGYVFSFAAPDLGFWVSALVYYGNFLLWGVIAAPTVSPGLPAS